ncbi:FUN14 family protein [Pseudohyphozyma bogoriensis]|nr:FUN14 family protein [Pseudohyphozyma bogoriensis]
MFAHRWPTPMATLFRHAAPLKPSSSLPRFPPPRTLCTTTPTTTSQSTSFLRSYRLALAISLPTLAISLPLLANAKEPLQCASDRTYARSPELEVNVPSASGGPPPRKEPESIVNVYELGFGTVAGICTGVFVKKGLKALAFALGGVFVLLQYFSSRSFININWGNITSSYDAAITKRAGPSGSNRVAGLWRWFIDFVGADIQGRATFVAGVVLGLRLVELVPSTAALLALIESRTDLARHVRTLRIVLHWSSKSMSCATPIALAFYIGGLLCGSSVTDIVRSPPTSREEGPQSYQESLGWISPVTKMTDPDRYVRLHGLFDFLPSSLVRLTLTQFRVEREELGALFDDSLLLPRLKTLRLCYYDGFEVLGDGAMESLKAAAAEREIVVMQEGSARTLIEFNGAPAGLVHQNSPPPAPKAILDGLTLPPVHPSRLSQYIRATPPSFGLITVVPGPPESDAEIAKWRSKETGLNAVLVGGGSNEKRFRATMVIPHEVKNNSGVAYVTSKMIFHASKKHPYWFHEVAENVERDLQMPKMSVVADVEQSHVRFYFECDSKDQLLIMLPIFVEYIFNARLSDVAFKAEVFGPRRDGGFDQTAIQRVKQRANDPAAVLQMALNRKIFPLAGGLHFDIHGELSDMLQLTNDDVHAYYQAAYIPADCTLIISGPTTLSPSLLLSTLVAEVESSIPHLSKASEAVIDRHTAVPIPPIITVSERDVVIEVPASINNEVWISWRGGSFDDWSFQSAARTRCLEEYLGGEGSVLRKEFARWPHLACGRVQVTSDINHNYSTFKIQLHNVQDSEVDTIATRVKNVVAAVAKAGVDMDRMGKVIDNLKNLMITGGVEFLVPFVVADALYGSSDGMDLHSAMHALDSMSLNAWGVDRWDSLLNETLINQPSITFVAEGITYRQSKASKT